MRVLRRSVAGPVCALSLVVVALAPASAAAGWSPPYYEVTEHTGKRAAGVMLVLHGGGWTGDPGGVVVERPNAERFADLGWTVWNVDYRSGSDGLEDVVDWYRVIDAGTDLPICVYGGSAGGHLALLLAELEDLACVISDDGPTDLRTLPDWMITDYAAPAFGTALWRYSPLRCAKNDPSIYGQTTFMLGHFYSDQVVPLDQARRFARAMPDRVELHVLKSGDVPFVHGYVDATQLQAHEDAETTMLGSVAKTAPRDDDAGSAADLAGPSAKFRLRGICLPPTS